MLLLRDVARLGIASKLSLLSPYTTSRSFSSRFGFTLSPILGVEPERTQSEGRAKALCENESEIGHFPTVFECKDSAELRHGKLFRAKNVTFPTFKKKRLSLVAKEALLCQKRSVGFDQQKTVFLPDEFGIKRNASPVLNTTSPIIREVSDI